MGLSPYNYGLIAIMHIGKRFAEIRRETGLNQIEFAKIMGVSKNSYQDYERGATMPPAVLIIEMCQRFNKDANWLLLGKTHHSLASRLQTLLKIVETPSIIAELIGEKNASQIEKAFLGEADLDFKQLDAIANLWRIRPEWLKHGTGSVFSVDFMHDFAVQDAYKFLHSNAVRLLLIRSQSVGGELAIVYDHGKGNYITYFTTLRLTDQIGSGGMSSAARLSNACRYINIIDSSRLTSYLIDESDFSELVKGSMYVGKILIKNNKTNWHEDWWDENQFRNSSSMEYWNNYKTFCERVFRQFEYSDSLMTERERIIAGNWSPEY